MKDMNSDFYEMRFSVEYDKYQLESLFETKKILEEQIKNIEEEIRIRNPPVVDDELAYCEIFRQQMEYLGLLVNPSFGISEVKDLPDDKISFKINEKELTKVMVAEPYKELKDYFQRVGNNVFGWKSD